MMSDMPHSSMKSYNFRSRGLPWEVLKAVDKPIPSPAGTNDVLVRIHAVGLNPAGYRLMRDFLYMLVKKPGVPELDLSGTIISVGSNAVTKWSPGDKVWGIIPAWEMMRKHNGALQEYAIVHPENLHEKPDFLSWEQVAVIPTAALTAYQFLLKYPKRKLSKGQSVFINGASGGVGTFAVQIARQIVGESGKVVGCCSAKNADLVRRLGADEVVDYKSVNLVEHLTQNYSNDRFDMILDAHGNWDLYHASPHFMKKDGDFSAVAFEEPSKGGRSALSGFSCLLSALFLPTWLGGTPRRLTMSVTKVVPEDLHAIGGMIERKEIVPILDSVWKFNDEDIKRAYEKIISGHAAGKVVISIRE